MLPKKEFSPPTITELGTIQDLTLDGNEGDHNFDGVGDDGPENENERS